MGPRPSFVRDISRSAFIAAPSGLVILLGGFVLIGWAFDISTLKSVLPGLVTMKANTALGFLLAGVSLWLLQSEKVEQRKQRLAQLCAFVVALVGLLTLSEYIFRTDLGIDQLLFREEPGAVGTSSPGRMAPTTAFNFLLLGVALLLLDVETGRGHRPAQYLSLFVGVISMLALIGYAYGVSALYGVASYTQMAVHTALGFLVLVLGLLFARPGRGFIAIVVSDSLGGEMFRRLLPVAVGVLVLLGWVRLQGQRAGLYETELGAALFAVQSIIILSILIWWSARSLDRADHERKKAEQALRRAHGELEQRVAERTEALRKSETRYHSTLDNMLEGAQIIGFDWSYLYVNDSAVRHGRQPKEKLLGYTMMERYPGIEGTEMFAVLRRCMEERTAQQMENEFTYPDGSKGWFELSIQPVPEGIFILTLDITERKRAEEALRRSENQLSLVYRHVSDIIFYLGVEPDEKFRFLSVNPAFSEATGLAESQVVGKLVQEVIPEPSLSTVVLPNYREAIRDKKTVQWEEVSVYPTGTKYGIVAVTPIFDANGQCTNLVGAVHDITDSRQAEEEIRRLNAELEQRVIERTAQLEAANKELEAFAYSVSHDLRAPLRSIDGFSQVLLEEYPDRLDEQGKDYLQRVRAGSQRMAQLIDDLLQLSRVTRSEMHREAVDLTAAAWTVAQGLKANQPERQVDLVVAPGVVANGDPRLLRVVLENFLNNAWKFTAPHPTARIEFGATENDGKPVYFVRDDGVGFDMAYADKLFGAFQRLHGTQEFPGTGIGLATVQRIIHRHGGRVWAEGEVGKGATFYFTLS